MKKLVLIAAAATLALGGCGQSNEQRCAQASNPAECMSWADAGGDIQDYLVGGMAGYMLGSVMSGGRRQTVIMQNPSYHGPHRYLHSPILSRDRQIQRMQAKIDRQRVELRRQQDANARKKREIRALRSGGGWKSTSSWGSSRSRFRSRK